MGSPPVWRRSNHHCRQWFAAILVYSLVLSRCDTISPSTSCTTSAAVEGQPASVTCQFPEDLSVHKDNFRITRYDFDGLRSLPEIVFECYWYLEDEFLECAAAAGFDWERHIRDTATLKIPNATQRHAGVYKCDFINAAYSHENGCSLHVRRREISCTGATVYSGEPANLTCHFNSDLSVTYDAFYIARLRPSDDFFHDALTCIWTESEPSQTLCYERPGYTFDSKVTNIVTIHIPAANQSHMGQYYCDTSPTRTGVARPVCNVTVIERMTTSSSSTFSFTTTSTSSASTTQSELQNMYTQPDTSGGNSLSDVSPVSVLTPLLVVFSIQTLQLACIWTKN